MILLLNLGHWPLCIVGSLISAFVCFIHCWHWLPIGFGFFRLIDIVVTCRCLFHLATLDSYLVEHLGMLELVHSGVCKYS